MTSSEIGLPIQYNANEHTYYYTDEDLRTCSFANLLLSPKDKQVLAFARSLMLSFFYNTESYLEVCKTFDTLMERLEYTQAFMDGPMPTALLIALKNSLCHFDIYDFVHAINSDVCLWIEMMAVPDIEDICILVRPVHVIYAWSSWYLLIYTVKSVSPTVCNTGEILITHLELRAVFIHGQNKSSIKKILTRILDML